MNFNEHELRSAIRELTPPVTLGRDKEGRLNIIQTGEEDVIRFTNLLINKLSEIKEDETNK